MLEMNAKLVGMTPKKGSGVLDNGTSWSTDHVDLHCLTPLNGSGEGYATTPYKIPNHDLNVEAARSAVGQDIVITMELKTNGKGGNPAVVPTGFRLLNGKKA